MEAVDSFTLVREAISLSSYVESTYGSVLHSRGSGKFATACPIHGGEKPNFHIDDNRGIWFCHSECASGGDIVTLWLAKNNSTSKKDALVSLAATAGVKLPERERSIDRRSMYDIMAKAAQMFAKALVSNKSVLDEPETIDKAWDWLTVERGLTDDEIELGQIGFVPDMPSLRGLLEDHLGTTSALLQCGILKKSAAGNIYCPFAGRVVFPIRDASNRVVGFGGRVVPGVTRHEENKFINTVQTDIYDKSHVLYGAEFISDKVERIVVCEGYMDALAVNALNDPTIAGVASCGTSITHSHIELIQEIGAPEARVVFVMDGDDAGLAATSRLSWAAEALGARGFGILLDPTEGKDPWDRYTKGSLAADIEEVHQRPLTEACLSAVKAVVKDDTEFDAAVAALIQSARTPDHSDALLRAASKVRKVSVGEYGETVRRQTLAKGGRARSNALRVDLSPSVRHLVARMLQVPPRELMAIASTFGGWDDQSQGFAKRWLPTKGLVDVAAIGYALFPHAEHYDTEVVEAVSSCMSEDDTVES